MRMLLTLIIGFLFCLFIPYFTVQAQHEVCGNGICEANEDCENCAQDCGICQSGDDDTETPGDDDTGNDDTDNKIIPPTIEQQLEMEQLKIKRTSDFSLKGAAIDDLRILWP